MSFSVLGGILLNIGAFYTMKGHIYKAVGAYLFADVCWIVVAYQKDDLLGMVLIVLGTLFGVVALIKMYTGKMKKVL
jgi:hypothetical protein